MTRRDPDVRLRQMLDAAREASDMAMGRTRGDLDADRPLNLSLVRLLEIVGEAANRVPRRERSRLAAVPWEGVVGLRNRLIHGYDYGTSISSGRS
ncbi:MAG TPA: HepT-like ribonuclease domain-containing protein [Dehalococcoidia bacterium]|nr:HepT-like ribonuclease domain-containing protein [Dehalococcoidia bacterium]